MMSETIEIMGIPKSDTIQDRLQAAFYRYNNLFRSIETGMAMRTIVCRQEAEDDPNSELKDDLPRIEEFNSALADEILRAGIAPEDIKKFSDRKALGAGGEQFLEDYLGKVIKVYNGLINQGFKEDEIVQ